MCFWYACLCTYSIAAQYMWWIQRKKPFLVRNESTWKKPLSPPPLGLFLIWQPPHDKIEYVPNIRVSYTKAYDAGGSPFIYIALIKVLLSFRWRDVGYMMFIQALELEHAFAARIYFGWASKVGIILIKLRDIGKMFCTVKSCFDFKFANTRTLYNPLFYKLVLNRLFCARYSSDR